MRRTPARVVIEWPSVAVLEARLGTAVARAAELVLTSPAAASTEIDDLAAELDRLVVELDSLSAATAELA